MALYFVYGNLVDKNVLQKMITNKISILRNIFQNMLIGLPYSSSIVSRYFHKSVSRSIEVENSIYDFYKSRSEIKGKDILEVGPGFSSKPLAMALLDGAHTVTAVDIIPYLKTNNLVPNRVQYYTYNGKYLPFQNDSFDLVWSLAVFEHFRFPQESVRDIFRVLRPSGKLVSRVDLRDHYHLNEEKKWIDCLEYPDWLWKLMAWNRAAYVNRMRFTQWKDLLENEGFVCNFEKEESEIVFNTSRKHPCMQKFSNDDLRIVQFNLVATKMNARKGV